MDRQGLRRLVELAIAVALTAVLSQIRVYKLPQGGSITAGSMVPIFYVALRWGFRWGLLAGLLAGVVNYITEPFYVQPEVIISSILTVLVLRAMERVQPVQPA